MGPSRRGNPVNAWARLRVKCCGITRVEDATLAATLGADAIGLVFTRCSPRCVGLEQALAIRAALPPLVAAVALFMDDEPGWVREVVEHVQPDLLQFHGDEDAGYAQQFGRRYLKAIAMADAGDPAARMAAHPHAAGFLLDGHARGEAGGRGRAFDWTRVPRHTGRPWLLAGGLDADNVAAAIRAARPYGVDVSSGIECAPGIKDPLRMRRFIAAVRAVEHDAAAPHSGTASPRD
ncbi:MAG: phosphoribosylanthranilate isomerase [Xanthomonadaceae bacterium]|nr:phosphoribosylanthranilate isomerase [Xanthomonadaceae bacterium]